MFNGIVWCEVTTSTTCLVCIEPTCHSQLVVPHCTVTQMDRDQFVPVSVIAGFNQVSEREGTRLYHSTVAYKVHVK